MSRFLLASLSATNVWCGLALATPDWLAAAAFSVAVLSGLSAIMPRDS